MKLAVIGAGISGLATAFYLRQLQPEWEVTVFEASARPGGTMGTEDREGFLFEAGSNGFLSNKPDTLDLVRDAGAEHLLMRSNDAARVRYIYSNALHRLPENPKAFLTTRLLSWRGKLRTLAEVLVPARREEGDETLKSFGDRRLGAEFTDTFLNAMSAGIYAAVPETLSVNAAFPLVVALERNHGGLFRGMLAKRRKEAGPGGVLMSFAGGVGTFVDHLADGLGDGLRRATPVTAISRDDAGYRLETPAGAVTADQVVMATPAFAAARVLRPLDPHLAMQLETIEYSPIAVVGLGYRHLDHPLEGFGLLTTAAAGKTILGVLWDSSVFPDRAPAGCKSLRVMIGGQRNPELALQDEDRLIAIALQGVRETMGVTTPPDVTFLRRWERGIPNYKLGHLALVDAIEAKARTHPGLHLNSNAYRGIGVNDCVRNSRALAESLAGTTAATRN